MAETSLPVVFKDVIAARERVASALSVTPLELSAGFSSSFDRQVYIKWDNKFPAGAFKERGATNFLLALTPDQKEKGVCAASMGNHALAVSSHAARLGIACTIVMPVISPLVKVQSTKATGAEVVLHGHTFAEASSHAQELCDKNSQIFVPAFDHKEIIAGQGTCGLELLDQLDDFDAVIVPVGGGGYISGIATAIKEKRPEVFILGVQSEWVAKVKQLAGQNGENYTPPTIADGIAVKTLGQLTSKIIEQKVDQLVTVSEQDISGAVVSLLEVEKAVVEGAGAASVAALMSGKLPSRFKKPVAVVCGSNIDVNLLSNLIMRELVRRGRWIRVMLSVPDRPGHLNRVTEIIAQKGGNILDVRHDRSSTMLGMVDIMFLLEVRDVDHGQCILAELGKSGVKLLSTLEINESLQF